MHERMSDCSLLQVKSRKMNLGARMAIIFGIMLSFPLDKTENSL